MKDISNQKITQKEFCDDGKYAAPRWLVYPELDAYTIGWRMGYGEDYAMNEPYYGEEFARLFPRPQNWLFDRMNCNLGLIPLLGYLWRENGEPKYTKISGNPIIVNDFITVEQTGEFQYNAFHFKSIENAVLMSKYASFNKNVDPYKTGLDELKKGFELTDEEIIHWNRFRYTVLLNACYYKFMQDDSLKQKLLDTGDECLVYVSDDEWGGEDNLLGFALMELRDEIRRLYEHADLIDWEYTEYLKHKNPYENPKPRHPEDRQSAEYMVVATTLNQAGCYVRDTNLDENLASKYEKGQIITEKAFVDASRRIGGMFTSHRYLILSNMMADLSKFEQGTNWGLSTANAGSRFMVLDVYTIGDKTQIMLLQLPDGFEEVFKTPRKIIDETVGKYRKSFEECLKSEPIEELTTPEWLERVEFPIGMDDEGNFF